MATLPYLLATVPALVVGVLSMRAFDVPTAVWGQNLAARGVGVLLYLGFGRSRASSPRSRWPDLLTLYGGVTCP
jgi:hypothetical protein